MSAKLTEAEVRALSSFLSYGPVPSWAARWNVFLSLHRRGLMKRASGGQTWIATRAGIDALAEYDARKEKTDAEG